MQHQQDAAKITSSLTNMHVLETSIMGPHHRVLSPLLALVESLQKEKLVKKAKVNPSELLFHGLKISEE